MVHGKTDYDDTYSLPSELIELVSTIERLRKEFLGKISEPDLEGIFYTMEGIREILKSDEKLNEKIELFSPEYIFLKEKAEELEDFLYSKKTIDFLIDLDG